MQPESAFMKSHFISSAAAALLVALLSTTASAQSASDEPSDTVEEGRDHTYSLGLSLVGSRFRTEDGYRMGMMGPGLTVNYTVGRQMGFGLRANITFPMHGRVAGNGEDDGVNLITMYDKQRLSFDTTYYFYYRLRPTEALDVVLGGGVHVHTLRLVGSQFDPIELIQGGLAGLARAEYRFADHFFLSGEVALAIDPIDFVKHQNRATLVAPIALTFAVGARR